MGNIIYFLVTIFGSLTILECTYVPKIEINFYQIFAKESKASKESENDSIDELPLPEYPDINSNEVTDFFLSKSLPKQNEYVSDHYIDNYLIANPQHRKYFDNNLLYEINVENRNHPGENELCPTITETYEPDEVLIDGKMAFVFRSERRSQGFVVHKCKENEDMSCPAKNFVKSGKEFIAKCVQLFATNNILVMKDGKNVTLEETRMPSCCKCVVVKNTGF